MKHLSLFSGIGGFDLPAQWMGWENVAHVELSLFCRRILNYYWPKAKSHGKIQEVDFKAYRGTVDIISAGFPCQPFSHAGKRMGSEDPRHLWPQVLRAVREISPKWVVLENVPGIVTWSEGMVFESICSEMEAEGYEIITFEIPASAVGAPHIRSRVFFVAYYNSSGREKFNRQSKPSKPRQLDSISRQSSLSHTYSQRQQREGSQCVRASHAHTIRADRPNVFAHNRRIRRGKVQCYLQPRASERPHIDSSIKYDAWHQWPNESPLCSGIYGLSEQLDTITVPSKKGRRTLKSSFPRWRRESVQAFGNAVVPQIVYRIFTAIQEFEKLTL